MTCMYESIYYNGYFFDGFTKSNLNSEMVKDDSGNIVKYIRNTLEIEFIVSVETCRIATGIVDKNIDWDMERIKDALSCANKSLNFSYRGMGLPVSRKGQLLEPPDRVFTLISGMGVQPEVLQWEPLAANKAARCRWRCVYYTSTGRFMGISQVNLDDELAPAKVSGGADGKRVPANSHNLAADWKWDNFILSVTEEQEVDIDSEGYLVLTLKGVIEFAGLTTTGYVQGTNTSASPVTTMIHTQNPPQANDLDLIEAYLSEPGSKRAVAQELARYFEPYLPLGFTRKQRYVYNKTHRQLEYVIVDTEQKCPKGKFPRIVNWEATHKVDSTIGTSDSPFQPQGFLTWGNVFSGSFTVAPGYWKGWAWVAMLVLVKQRILNTLPLEGDIAQKLKDEVDGSDAAVSGVPGVGQVAKALERKTLTPRHLLTDVMITEYLHDNRVDFMLRYIVITSLSKLFANTGLFTKVNSLFKNGAVNLGDGIVPTGSPSTWVAQSRGDILNANRVADTLSTNAVGYNGLGLANYNIIFDPNNLNLQTTLPNGSPLKDDNGVVFPAWTSPPDPYNASPNVQSPNLYSAYRRQHHYVEHEDEPFDETTPTNPQSPKDAGGIGPVKAGDASPYPGEETQQATWMKNLDPAYSWADYKTNFELVEVSNSSYLPTIQAAPLSEIKGTLDTSLDQNFDRKYTKLTINNKTTAFGAGSDRPNKTRYADHAVIAHGKPLYYLRFTGSATRVGYPIPMPVVGGMQNLNDATVVLDVYRVGKQYWSHRQAGQSADMPLFEAEWDITYAIQGDPTCANIGFNHIRMSEFA